MHNSSEQNGRAKSEPSGGDSESDSNDDPFERLLLRSVHTVSWREARHGALFQMLDFLCCVRRVSSVQNEFHPETKR